MPTAIAFDSTVFHTNGYSCVLASALWRGLATIPKSFRGVERGTQKIVAFPSKVLIDCDLRNPHTDKSNSTIIQYFFLQNKAISILLEEIFHPSVPPLSFP